MEVSLPIDLYNIVLSYYFESSNGEWRFVENRKIPLTCNCACVLVNESDIIIFQHCDENTNGSDGNIYKYNIDKQELVQIKGIKTPKQNISFDAVYLKTTNRIYLIDRNNGNCVNSIDLPSILSHKDV